MTRRKDETIEEFEIRRTAYSQEYRSRPKTIDRRKKYHKEYHANPINKERSQNLNQTPERKLRRELRTSTNEYKNKRRERARTLEAKLLRKKSRSKPQNRANRYARRKRPNRKQWRSNYFKQRKQNCPQFKLETSIKRSIRHALKGVKAGRHWEDLVGYTGKELKEHLENLWLPSMSWENYGLKGWHIDHKIPESLWQYTKPEDSEFKQCWCLANLQPLWAKDNLKKSNHC